MIPGARSVMEERYKRERPPVLGGIAIDQVESSLDGVQRSITVIMKRLGEIRLQLQQANDLLSQLREREGDLLRQKAHFEGLYERARLTKEQQEKEREQAANRLIDEIRKQVARITGKEVSREEALQFALERKHEEAGE